MNENIAIALVIIAVIFSVARNFFLWFWKVQERIDNQRKIITLLEKISSKTGDGDAKTTDSTKNLKSSTKNEPALVE